MISVPSLIRNNLPNAKPELWQNLSKVVRRRTLAWLSERMDAAWAQRPCVATIEPEGLLIEVLPHETVSRSIVHYGVYEYAPSMLLRAYLRKGDAFVDVGANLGYYSIVAASLVGPTGRVVAFEPSAGVRARMERSLALNALRNVIVRCDAVGRVNGTVRLLESQDPNNHGLAFVNADDGSATAGIPVPCVRLDNALRNDSSDVALLKIDVEGTEPDVLAGAKEMLSNADAPSILFESFRIAEDRQLLESYGYRIYVPGLRAGRLCLRELGKQKSYRDWEPPNYFAVKSARGREFVSTILAS